ncbi:hypothetical protein [Pseudoxanthomonas sacheonensis]|uniref:hypothetical protein n=1 Tax=Pseudoxanthomonas sacheonensis TaxID=443615 RepID=UPI0013D751DC|nr:hypothetical protein [Pseudoxanthomonas sacheonensis]KAF1706241.1 hypothetical protein CSC73_16170 [Pseudoxanthomonas sacheonensis]
MTTELVELAPCICGAVVDQEECPYPSGPYILGGGERQLYKVSCTGGDCGWMCVGYGADGARKAWNTRALASRAGGWRPIESAPRTGIAVLLFQPWKSGRNCAVIGHYANGWVGSDIEDLQ